MNITGSCSTIGRSGYKCSCGAESPSTASHDSSDTPFDYTADAGANPVDANYSCADCNVTIEPVTVTGIKVDFDGDDTEAWASSGSYDAKANLTSDSHDTNNLTWTISTVSGAAATIGSDGTVSYGTGGGEYTITAASDDLTSESDTMTLKVVNVGLQKISGLRSPALADAGRICLNAQDEYKKAKFKATVKPEGTTAKVSSTGYDANVNVSGASSGVDTNNLMNGDEIWVEEAGETGTYEITLEHKDCSDSTDTYSETVFEFEFDHQKVNSSSSWSSGGTNAEPSCDESRGACESPKMLTPDGAENTAMVSWKYELKVISSDGAFSGTVKAKVHTELNTMGQFEIHTYPKSLGADDIAASVSWKFLNFSVSGTGGTGYGHCVAGTSTKIRVEDIAYQGGTTSKTSKDVGIPTIMPEKTETYNVSRTQQQNDTSRNYNVGITTYDVKYKFGAGSNSARVPRYPFPSDESGVSKNQQVIQTIKITEKDGIYEIQ